MRMLDCREVDITIVWDVVIDGRASVVDSAIHAEWDVIRVIRFIRRLTTMVLTRALFLLQEDNSVLSVNDI